MRSSYAPSSNYTVTKTAIKVTTAVGVSSYVASTSGSARQQAYTPPPPPPKSSAYAYYRPAPQAAVYRRSFTPQQTHIYVSQPTSHIWMLPIGYHSSGYDPYYAGSSFSTTNVYNFDTSAPTQAMVEQPAIDVGHDVGDRIFAMLAAEIFIVLLGMLVYEFFRQNIAWLDGGYHVYSGKPERYLKKKRAYQTRALTGTAVLSALSIFYWSLIW